VKATFDGFAEAVYGLDDAGAAARAPEDREVSPALYICCLGHTF
jgi:hypothetical protein